MQSTQPTGQFRVVMLGGPVDGERKTMVRPGAVSPGTSIGVPLGHPWTGSMAWYDRAGDEPVSDHWVFIYRTTSGGDRGQAALATPERELAQYA